MELVLNADRARTLGTRPSRRLRREGRIPAVIYGLNAGPVPVSVDWKDLRRCLVTEAGVNAVITVDSGAARDMCIVKEIQRHPVRRDVTHIDFLRVDPSRTVTVDIPVTLTGDALKVTAKQGIVDQQLFRVTVSVRPDEIPNELVVDVTDLDLGDAVTVGDLHLPRGVEAVTDAGAIVAQGLATRSSMMLQTDEGADEEAAVDEQVDEQGEAAEGESAAGGPESDQAEASEGADDQE